MLRRRDAIQMEYDLVVDELNKRKDEKEHVRKANNQTQHGYMRHRKFMWSTDKMGGTKYQSEYWECLFLSITQSEASVLYMKAAVSGRLSRLPKSFFATR